ncbi:Dps family protein [Pseudokordiimonas caeni]|uniref:Dps family protein n=1 Tax=Pseudokordiimonas caeni TaxID=2997908 RepID=UPI002811E53A|nr:DNA starvation/stationary phase protection protein [Pseudokordiimonas caeni]
MSPKTTKKSATAKAAAASPAVADDLKVILAETVQLYILTYNVHWNVTGPLFQPVHLLTETQYTELALAVDEVAERIRTLGQKAPAGFKAYQKLGSIADGDENASAEEMVKSLVDAHAHLAARIRPVIGKAAEVHDEVTAGLLTDRLQAHEKAGWMLGAMLA